MFPRGNSTSRHRVLGLFLATQLPQDSATDWEISLLQYSEITRGENPDTAFKMQMPDMPVNVPVDDPNADTEW